MTSPPIPSSATLADTVRKGWAWYGTSGDAEEAISDADAALAQLVARLEQAERALQRIEDAAKRGKIEVERVTFDRPVFVAPNIAAHHFDIVRGLARAALSGGDNTAESALAACEHTRDDALSALHYIKQRYGPLDGVGWNRLTGEKV